MDQQGNGTSAGDRPNRHSGGCGKILRIWLIISAVQRCLNILHTRRGDSNSRDRSERVNITVRSTRKSDATQ